jgi:beta-lactamase class D
MKKVTLKEEAYKKLLNEIGYGNDDLGNLCNDMRYEIDDALQIVRDHMTMCERLKQEPNAYVVEINEHLNAIKEALDALGGGLN